MEVHRLTDRMINYWNLLRRDRVMPYYSEINPSAVGDLWQKCLVFAVQPSVDVAAAAVSFQFVGEDVRSLYQDDMVGRHVQPNHRHFQGAAILRLIPDVLVHPAALQDAGQFVNARSKVVKFRSCLLPFGGADGKVTHVVAGLSWREF